MMGGTPMPRALRAGAVAVAVAAAFTFGAQRADSRTLQLSDMRGAIGVGTPQISPDGRQIAVVTRTRDYIKDRSDRELMLVDVRTGAVRPLTYDRIHVGEVRWSPDGKSIAFIATSGTGDDAQDQVFVMPLSGGDAHVVTTAKNGVDEFAWRPDGKALAFVADDDAPNKAQIDKHLDAFEVGHNDYLATSVPPSSQLWIVPAAGGTNKKLTRGSWQLSQLSWSPDGRTVAADVTHSLFSGDSDQASIEVVDARTGAMRALTGRKQRESNPLFSPDGSKIAYGFVPGDSVARESQAFVSPAAGGPGVEISRSIDREISPLAWTPDGKSLLVAGDDGLTQTLWLVGSNGVARKAPLGDVSFVDGTISKTGELAILGGAPQRPAEVYFANSVDTTPRRLTNFNAKIAALDMGALRPVSWTSEGFAEDGVLTLPPKGATPTSKPPLVVLIHGGPTASSSMSFDSGYGGLSQLLAAKGWAVFEPNYRGSDNLGARYMEATIGDLGPGPGRDIVAGVRSLERAGLVDPNRVAVGGWSEGGCLTAWLITHYTMWRAAMAGAAVTDWIAEYNLSDAVYYEQAIAGGSPWIGDGWSKLAAESAIGAAANVRTPTLIMSDTGDYRVPTPQEYAFYHALRDHGVEVQYVAFPVHGHFPPDPVRTEEIYKRWIAWYETHL